MRARVEAAVAELAARVQRDEGGRGIGAFARPEQLIAAARALHDRPGSVLILTGFYCLRDRTPPCETDGPPGAVALAHTLLALGQRPTLLIEDHSAEVLQLCAAASTAGGGSVPAVEVFPTADRWTAGDDARLEALRAAASSVLSIERSGEAADGVCYTMRALPMGPSLVANKINSLATPGTGLATVAIGDGGNELGMGNFIDAVREHVKLGETIGCVVPADAPLVASVSNWGGYALCTALALLAWEEGRALPALRTADDFLAAAVPSQQMARNAILAANEGGAADGITAATDGAVDGMPLATQLEVLEELRGIAREAMRHVPRGTPA